MAAEFRGSPLRQARQLGAIDGLPESGYNALSAMPKLGLAGDLARFLATRKRYWLLPMAITLLLLGLLVLLTEGSSVAPFIYTLF